MTPEIEALRSNRVVIVSVVAAAVSVTLLCLVGIALMLGWVGGRHGAATPVSIASPGLQLPGTAPAVDLVAGETLVSPAGAAAPTPAPPVVPAARPEPPAQTGPAARPRPATPSHSRQREPKADRAPPKSTRAEPATVPGSARSEAHRTDPGDPWPRRFVCRTCGTVTAIAAFPDLWEVHVRLEDGASFTVRYPSPPTLRVGDRVRLANGRLERE